MIIDTHNHLYFPKFADQLDSVLVRSRQAGVTKQVLIGIDELSCQASLNLAAKYDDFSVVLGLHPCDVDQLGVYDPAHHQYVGVALDVRPKFNDFDSYFAWLDELATQHGDLVVGFGETGFDQFHRHFDELLAQQTDCFERHLDLCMKHQKTLVIHSRGARDETLSFLKNHKPEISNLKFIWHCFTEDLEAAQMVVDMGGYLGVGGVLTYPKSNALREVIQKTPLQYLLTETDAPFLTPQVARKQGAKLNSPAFLPEVVELISKLKNLDRQVCENQLWENGQKMFNV